MLNQNKMHLVPDIIQSKVKELLNENSRFEIRENYASQLEAIKNYCDLALKQYNISKENNLFKRKKKV